jgi:MHS family proline/betaine transporter-like MFS transporter
VYIKKYTNETPLFEDAKYRGEIVKSPLRVAFKTYWFDMLISIFINCTGSVIFYIEAIYLMSYLQINRGFDTYSVSILINFCYVIMAVVTLLTGWLSDKIGRRKIFIINLMGVIAITPVLMEILETGDFVAVAGAQIILAIMAAAYIGPEPALQAEFYPTNVRNTALSVSYNTATSVFGGTAPYIIESLVQSSGTLSSSVYYIIACAITSLIALYFYKDRSSLEHKFHIDDN